MVFAAIGRSYTASTKKWLWHAVGHGLLETTVPQAWLREGTLISSQALDQRPSPNGSREQKHRTTKASGIGAEG